MKTSISDFLPEKEETIVVQVHVERKLAEETRAMLDQHGKKTWTEFVEAAMKAYVAEKRSELKKRKAT